MPQLLQRRNGYDDDIIIITDLTECFYFLLLPLFQLQLIFSGEYTKAMSKDWHLGHFSCWQCDESLTGQRYVLRDEHPYCVKCYETVFANSCDDCNRIIGIDSKVQYLTIRSTYFSNLALHHLSQMASSRVHSAFSRLSLDLSSFTWRIFLFSPLFKCAIFKKIEIN